ncbi:hypothetical protein [Scleromatobacter humisilvae]|uniref:Uncharacterized protein n=1 Tax=Scleromatobacter humisilvae TaxID=2897159 RepID=A0A9X1YG41_9BURK|nr:hypothetical protein [Scleromatobacter humisilvae]MCK9684205.1 hypothetical protein [Scleromatobacter humisilvae]
MHIEPPKVSMHSAKEFITHYLMIVLSVLTALGLEAVLERMHHAHAAEAAQHAIEVELRDNVAQISKTIAANEQTRAPLRRLSEHLIQELQAGKARPEVAAEIAQLVNSGQLDIGLHTPTLRHEAWDVAVANQSATYIEDASLARITAAYAQQREAISARSTALFDGPRFVSAVTDARMNDVDPREFVRALEQALAANDTVINALTALRLTVSQALPAEHAASGAKG